MPAPTDPAIVEAVLEALRANVDATEKRPRAAIARDHGIAPSTVSKLARDHGIADAFDRTRTEHASRAKATDNRARRAALSTGMLEDAEKLRARLWEGAVIVSATGSKVTLELPPASDVRAFAGAITGLVKGSLEVDKRDAEDDSHAAVDEWLRSLMPGTDVL